MFWVKFWSFVMGYLNIIVESKEVEKLVNMAVSRGIYLWDICQIGPDKVLLKSRVSSFRALRHIVRRTGGRMRIKEKKGIPFYTAKVMKRQMLIIGGIACIAILYIMSSFIWFIEIEGNKKVSSKVILNEAEKFGLYVGTAKWKFDSAQLEKQLRNNLPQLSWVGISVTGTKAKIKVAEKTEAPLSEDQPAHIIAEKSGLIEEVLVKTGQAVIEEGKLVKKGDLLISGIVTTETEAPPGSGTEESEEQEPEEIITQRYVRAKGIVKARVWYEGYGEAQLISQKTVKTGRYSRVLQLKIGSNSITLQGSEKIPYKNYTESRKVKRVPGWRNIRIPVEVVTTNYYETKKLEERHSWTEAIQLARALAEKQLDNVMPAKAKVVNQKMHIIKTNEPNIVRVKISVETQENIGIAKPLKQGEMHGEPLRQDQEVRHN